ncbi:MAG: hypothetical protein QG608_912 [Actinomycetota bacterium]|nr:hypothetical protein [Actinomycetota bacterium]
MLAGVTGRTTGAIRRASGRLRPTPAHTTVDLTDGVGLASTVVNLTDGALELTERVVDLTEGTAAPTDGPVGTTGGSVGTTGGSVGTTGGSVGTTACLEPEQIAATMHRGGLEVHYQPIVLMPSQQIIAFEALARLRTADGRLVEPEHFIPVAESSGLVLELGSAVLREALGQAARWRSTVPCLARATVSVNVTPSQLRGEQFLQEVQQQLQDHNLPGSCLTLEITESTAASDSVRPALERFSELGIRIALDDFGTGFANLDNLRRFPVQIIKLDRSFVEGVTRAGTERSIVRALIDLADDLGLSVIAEGVENREQVEALSHFGCHLLQGYLLARPSASPETLVTRIESERPRQCPRDVIADWGTQTDSAVLAAARMLARGTDRRRAATHVLAVRGARELGLPETTVRLTGRLALVHDLRRLAVDGQLPEALAGVRPLRALAGFEPPDEGHRVERNLVDLALEAVRLAEGENCEHTPLDPEALRRGLLELRERRSLGGDSCPALFEALDRMIDRPPGVPPLPDLLAQLDKRAHGLRNTGERLRPLASVVQALSGSLDTPELLRVTLGEARRIVGAGSIALERWERGTGRLHCLARSGHMLPEICGCFQDLMERSVLVFATDDPGLPGHITEDLRRSGFRSVAHVPVELDGRLWGWIRLGTRYAETPFCEGDVDLLTAVAVLVGSAIDRAEHLDPNFRPRGEDPLTRVGDRRSVERALVEFSEGGLPVTLALLDLALASRGAGSARRSTGLVALADAVSREMISWPGVVIGRTAAWELCVAVPRSAPELPGWLRGRLAGGGGSGLPVVSVGSALGERGTWDPSELLSMAAADLPVARTGSGRIANRAAARGSRRAPAG